MLKVIWVDLVHINSESAGRLETRGSPSSIEAIDLFFCFFVFFKNGCLLALRYESCANPATYYKPPLPPHVFHLSPDCLILVSYHRLCDITISSM